jgi:S1-C subfamily serine protease
MATLYDARRVKAEVIGIDPETDVAVLQLARMSNEKFAAVLPGDSDHVRVGQRTLLVGSPLGLGFSLSSGIISRLGPLPLGGAHSGVRIIQTTTINPGNSGGPMLVFDGRVIGMVTFMVIGAQNIRFAIPINTIKGLLAELKEKGASFGPGSASEVNF